MQFHNFATIDEAWGTDMLPSPAQHRVKKPRKKQQQQQQQQQHCGKASLAQINDADPWCDLYNDGYSHQQVDKIMDMYTPGDDTESDARYKHDMGDEEGDDDEHVRKEPTITKTKKLESYSDGAKKLTQVATTEHLQQQQQQHDAPSSSYLELGVYVISGMILIIMMEQFVQIGMNIRG